MLKDGDYNLVAVAITPWHAISIDALILYLQAKDIKIKAAISILPHYKTGYAINENYFINKCSTYYLYSYKELSKEKTFDNASIIKKLKNLTKHYWCIFRDEFLLRNNGNLYYASSIHYATKIRKCSEKQQKHVIICSSEEGVATYMGTMKASQIKYRRGVGLKNIIFDMADLWYMIIHSKETCKILKKNIWGWSVNQRIIPYYRKVFDCLNEKFGCHIDKNMLSQSIIVCTTAWERDLIYKNEDYEVLKKVCKYLEGCGYNLLLKTHPRDEFYKTKVEELGCSLLNSGGMSIECICEYCTPKAIISFSSTALITAKIFWNIPVFCLSDMLDRQNIDPFYLNEIDCFKRTFYRQVKFVKSVTEIF